MLPASTNKDARLLLLTRGARGFADGIVSVLLADYLQRLGFSPPAVGAIVTGTLAGSAALTIAVGLSSHRFPRRPVLLGASLLMAATGIGFASFSSFWPLLVVAIVGTLNPSAGDVSLFLPTEQAMLAQVVPGRDRTLVYAWYNLVGALAGAAGALASGLPQSLARLSGGSVLPAERAAFVVYTVVGVAVAFAYRRLSPAIETPGAGSAGPLARSRAIVLKLAALFSLDSFGGGFAVQSLVVLWLFRRFQLPLATTASIFFLVGILGAFSQLASAWVAARIGLVRTMVYTHLPSNLFLVLAGVMPTAPLAVGCLLVRSALSQMDVPARQSFVMAVVPAAERAAASSVTNVPRSLAAAIPPLLAGFLLERSQLGWPLVIAGLVKACYDLILLAQFRKVRPIDD